MLGKVLQNVTFSDPNFLSPTQRYALPSFLLSPRGCIEGKKRLVRNTFLHSLSQVLKVSKPVLRVPKVMSKLGLFGGLGLRVFTVTNLLFILFLSLCYLLSSHILVVRLFLSSSGLLLNFLLCFVSVT